MPERHVQNKNGHEKYLKPTGGERFSVTRGKNAEKLITLLHQNLGQARLQTPFTLHFDMGCSWVGPVYTEPGSAQLFPMEVITNELFE